MDGQPSAPVPTSTPTASSKSHFKTRAHPCLQFDLTLAQANCACPALAELSNNDLAEKINGALMDTGCFFETKPCTPCHDRINSLECITPHIHTVGRHCSGDIWLAAYSKAEHDFLVGTAHHWVPQLSDWLSIAQKAYPILVHGMPTDFDPSHNGDDIHHFIAQNDHLITHPSAFQHAKFLRSQHHATSLHKTRGSLVIYLTEVQAANDCIIHHVAYQGWILPTVKFTRWLLQCYNCHCFRHFMQMCKATMACGCCAGAHAMCDCKCPAATECTTPALCQHVQLACAACASPHPASHPSCPVWKTSNLACRQQSPLCVTPMHTVTCRGRMDIKLKMPLCMEGRWMSSSDSPRNRN